MDDLAGTGSHPEIDNSSLFIRILARQDWINDNDIPVFIFRNVERGFEKIGEQIDIARIAEQELKNGIAFWRQNRFRHMSYLRVIKTAERFAMPFSVSNCRAVKVSKKNFMSE
jgi:hypothetical protein